MPKIPEVVSKERAVLAIFLVIINMFVLSYPMVAQGIQALGGFAGAFAAWVTSFVTIYVGLLLAGVISKYLKLKVAI